MTTAGTGCRCRPDHPGRAWVPMRCMRCASGPGSIGPAGSLPARPPERHRQAEDGPPGRPEKAKNRERAGKDFGLWLLSRSELSGCRQISERQSRIKKSLWSLAGQSGSPSGSDGLPANFRTTKPGKEKSLAAGNPAEGKKTPAPPPAEIFALWSAGRSAAEVGRTKGKNLGQPGNPAYGLGRQNRACKSHSKNGRKRPGL